MKMDELDTLSVTILHFLYIQRNYIFNRMHTSDSGGVTTKLKQLIETNSVTPFSVCSGEGTVVPLLIAFHNPLCVTDRRLVYRLMQPPGFSAQSHRSD